jgi:glycosyltransferase involved in cell wall biosynthesis
VSLSFAVIIPVYNGSKHLAETLESVLAQTLPPQEIIVIEDGSPKPSAEVVAKYPTVRYVLQKNAGVSRSRNHGASLATADWLCFLDQDDLILPNHLEQVSEAVAANHAIDVCYGGRLILSNSANGWTTSRAVPPPAVAELRSVLLHRCPFPPSGICIRKSAFTESSGFLSRYDLAEDWECWVRLMSQGRVFHCCTEYTMCYRVHLESVSHCRPLPILSANLRVIRERIFPLLSPWARLWSGRSMVSRQEADAAILLRQTGQPGGLTLILKSIVRFPLHDLRRYKIAGHMMLTSSGILSDRSSSLQSAH